MKLILSVSHLVRRAKEVITEVGTMTADDHTRAIDLLALLFLSHRLKQGSKG